MSARFFRWLCGLMVLVLISACGAPLEPARVATAAPIGDRPSPESVTSVVTLPPIAATSQSVAPTPAVPAAFATVADYDIGNPVLSELFISPTGDDANSGTSPASPLRTLTAAWGKIPTGALTGTGYRLNLLPGTYPCEPDEATNCVNQLTDRTGTYAQPIIIRAYNGRGTVTLRGGLDVAHVSYLYLIDLTLAGGGDIPVNHSYNNLLHLYDGHYVLLRGVTLAGPDCDNDVCNNLQEVFKVNQAQHVYVEDSVMGGSHHTVLDYFAVQYGHILRSQFHTAAQWGIYLKGGTAYLHIEGNELHHSTLGFQAGQSSNLAMMQAPWLHYEAYDIKFVNNLLHDLSGVPLSVSGGYNILIAYNTAYRVATRVDPGYMLVQAIHGERGCNATDELPNPLPTCQSLTTQGAWGPNIVTDNLPSIPNRNIFVYNNLFYNPAPVQTQYAHFNILAAIARPIGFQNLPASVPTDENLIIAGNLIWNGPGDHPLGVDNGTGCADANSTCNAAQLVISNTINLSEPQLVNPVGGDYRPLAGGNVFSVTTYALPDFGWDTFSPSVPIGTLTNTVTTDYAGHARSAFSPPGAFVDGGAALDQRVFLAMLGR